MERALWQGTLKHIECRSRMALNQSRLEQKARQTLKFADRAYVLKTGRMVMSGTASELAGNAAVSEAFLGAGKRQQDHAI
jgi:ABC-type branched-subunit amino acid transport system ATPase component